MSEAKINIQQYCNFVKGYIIPQTPKGFGASVVNSFKYGLSDDEIETGITAFREMLYKLFDTIAKFKGDESAIKKDYKKKYEKNDYRRYTDVLNHLAWILYRIGQAELETKPSIRLVGKVENYFLVYKAGVYELDERHREVYLLLTGLGFRFSSIDLTKNEKFTGSDTFVVEHEDISIIIGTKLMAAALDNTKDNSIKPHNTIMRCDFTPLANEKISALKLCIHDFIRSLPLQAREWIVDIDDWLAENGCKAESKKDNLSTDTTFIYTTVKGKKKVEVCRVFISVHGCSMSISGDTYPIDEETDFEKLRGYIELDFRAL